RRLQPWPRQAQSGADRVLKQRYPRPEPRRMRPGGLCSPACAPRLDGPMPTEGMASPGSQPGLTSTVGAPHRLAIGVVAALAPIPALPRRRGGGKGARRKLKAGKLKVGRSRGRREGFGPMARGARNARLRSLLPPRSEEHTSELQSRENI